MINKNEDMRNSTKEEIKDDMEKFEYKIENDEKQFIIKVKIQANIKYNKSNNFILFDLNILALIPSPTYNVSIS